MAHFEAQTINYKSDHHTIRKLNISFVFSLINFCPSNDLLVVLECPSTALHVTLSSFQLLKATCSTFLAHQEAAAHMPGITDIST